MIPIERRYRRLLRAYPGWYRSQRGDEMLDTLMAAAPAARWPSLRDSRALLIGGMRVRAGQDQRLGTRANLRLAALLGVILSLTWLMVSELAAIIQIWAPSTGYHLVGTMLTYLVLTLAAVAAAWFAPWWATAALALAAAGFWLAWDGSLVMALQPAGLLVLLAALGRGRDRLPRHWLVLAGGVFTVAALHGLDFEPGLPFIQHPLGPVPAALAALTAWVIVGLVVLWAVVDARPALALAICLISHYLVINLVMYAGAGIVPLAARPVWLSAAGAAALALGAIWRVRRQAVL